MTKKYRTRAEIREEILKFLRSNREVSISKVLMKVKSNFYSVYSILEELSNEGKVVIIKTISDVDGKEVVNAVIIKYVGERSV